ncbi:MAG: DUF4365 domain-containing protein [Treponemataceae bacterium]
MYPIRSDSHIKEQLGISKLKSELPEEWVLRTMQERDYGHDAILQLTRSHTGEVLPLCIGFQIKYREQFASSVVIKTSTYNYLYTGNIPSFIFVTNGFQSKIFCVSNLPLNCRGKTCTIPDHCFSKISHQQDLINYICYHSYLFINKDRHKINLLKFCNDFEMIFNALSENNIEYLWTYYKKNKKSIHHVLIYIQRGVTCLSDLFNIDISIERLKTPYEKKDVYILMLLFLNSIYLESEGVGEKIDHSKKRKLQEMVINYRCETFRSFVGGVESL